MTSSGLSDARKTRRSRRRQDKPAISARLVLDDHVKSEVGMLSQDLFEDLFPHLQADQNDGQLDQTPTVADVLHVAIAPWAPPANAPECASWTVVPVTTCSALAHSTIQFSSSTNALQFFATHFGEVAPSRSSNHSRNGIEILVLDVTAVSLDTVLVRLEMEVVRRLEEGEGTFFGDRKGIGNEGKAGLPGDGLTTAVRVALSALKVVHTGDMFTLPLPPHPVSQMPYSGKIILCEPVAQGILASSTRIILSRGRAPSGRKRSSMPSLSGHQAHGLSEDGEDTADDKFYSATEERAKTDGPTELIESLSTEAETEDADAEEDEISDDSMGEMITLATPSLPNTSTSGISSAQIGSPTAIRRVGRTNETHSPGGASLFSNFSASTVRPDGRRGRVFKAQGLMKAIPPQLLHPRPLAEDDEEGRVYVEIRDLPRVGCFSGDWAQMEAAEEPVPGPGGLDMLELGSMGKDERDVNWRPVRVFGLPEGHGSRSSSRPVTRIASSKKDGRRPSFFDSRLSARSSPTVFLSPILLTNLEHASHVRLSPLGRECTFGKAVPAKQSGAKQPPYAREVILQRVRTPVSSQRDVDTAIMACLKHYFEKKLRILRSGDVIGVPIDTHLCRTVQEASPAAESGVDELLSLMSEGQGQDLLFDEVAWFKVSHMEAMKSDGTDKSEAANVWGSAACVDISLTRLEQSGFVTWRLPSIMGSTWQSYLGIRKTASRSLALSTPVRERGQGQMSRLRSRLREVLAAATSKRAVQLKMPPVAILLVSKQRNMGKATTAAGACLDLGLHTFSLDGYDILTEAGAGGSDVQTAGLVQARAERAMSCGPECCALLIRHLEALTADRMQSCIRDILARVRVLIATTTEVEKIPDGIRALFSHELEMTAPDERERESVLRDVLDERGLELDVDLDLAAVSLKTAALVAGDLVDVVDRAVVAQRTRLDRLARRMTSGEKVVTVHHVRAAGGPAVVGLGKTDFDEAVDAARKNFADAIGAPSIPNVTWDDVGGLGKVKEAIRETIQLPLERPELFAKGMKKRSGILLYGPPGTGKTLLAKAIATEYSLNFFSVKGPELLNMYIGESEANVRRVFARARDARPCVVFFDELDSVAPKRGNQGDSGGVMDRIVSQLLAELDGMSGSDDTAGVFVVGATNRPDLLDQALLRPGRFDKMLYLGLSDTHEKQLTIMDALTRKFILHPDLSLRSVAEKLPFTYTGADLYALCSDAMLKAVTRQAARADAKIRAMCDAGNSISTAAFFDHHATPQDIAVTVTEQDFLDAHRELVPSVSAGELAHYEHVRATFEGGGFLPPSHGPLSARPANAGPGRSIPPSASRASVRRKGKIRNREKGKAVLMEDDDDLTDFGREEDGGRVPNKGKGKAVLAFGDGGSDEQDDLY